jgi:putative ABC transport system ATP-binding protein
VTVARSLVNDPTIVWADEPTGALDSETSAQIMQLLVELNRQQGQTFVLVTHDISVARRAHRIVRMRDGRIENDEQNGEGGQDG